ncbi:MAG: PHP-associated domain-containing protein [Candidatus ainarchaeum sp.]|nr:PHP-associated domain-containing protein [Candidatus ainarchaeum sp.]
MKIDFHVHTGHSPDSLIRVADLMRKSKALGVIPVLADHYSIGAHAEARKLGMRFIPGEEILTDKGDLIGLYVSDLIPKNTPFMEAMDRIHEQGGLACLPHMFDYRRPSSHATEEEAAKADIIEVFNARCLGQSLNDRAAEFAAKHGKPGAVGSDSHFLFEFGTTYAEMPEFDIENPWLLLRSLPQAKLVKKSAPFYVRGTTSMIFAAKRLLRRV